MNNEFISCPGCGKSHNGATLYECGHCGYFMCYYTDGLFGWNDKGCWKGDRCPRCASDKRKNGVEIIKPVGRVFKRQ